MNRGVLLVRVLDISLWPVLVLIFPRNSSPPPSDTVAHFFNQENAKGYKKRNTKKHQRTPK